MIYKMILFLGYKAGGKSVSPSPSLMSISAVRLICDIGTSLALPSNGFSVLSPTYHLRYDRREANSWRLMLWLNLHILVTEPVFVFELADTGIFAGNK